MLCKTYLDTGVLIAAFKGDEAASDRALEIIGNETRAFIVSDLLTLECVSPALANGYLEQADFCQKFIAEGINTPLSAASTGWAVERASKCCIGAMDVLHMAVAVEAGADEFITTEAPTKGFFNLDAPLQVTTIYQVEVVEGE